MKEGIHPEYFETLVTCGCGNKFKTHSTRKELKVDICNACHPFYTGKLKYVDTAGRIEKFQNKFAAGSYASLERPKKKIGIRCRLPCRFGAQPYASPRAEAVPRRRTSALRERCGAGVVCLAAPEQVGGGRPGLAAARSPALAAMPGGRAGSAAVVLGNG